jgi:hypothetical protein
LQYDKIPGLERKTKMKRLGQILAVGIILFAISAATHEEMS